MSKKASSSGEGGERNRNIITNSKGVLVGGGSSVGSAAGPSPDKMVTFKFFLMILCCVSRVKKSQMRERRPSRIRRRRTRIED
jgi:hypothetical protein